jgi:GntR family transcriptional regulator
MLGPSLIKVDTADPTPPYEQLRRQLADLITSRLLAPGDRLPPVRQLANDLGLAAGTIARTYRELESSGFIQTRRGGGSRVATSTPSMTPEQRGQQLTAYARTYAQHAYQLGFSLTDAIDALNTTTGELATQ